VITKCDGSSCFKIEVSMNIIYVYTANFKNVRITRFGQSRYLVGESEVIGLKAINRNMKQSACGNV